MNENTIFLNKAILSLKPGSEFTFYGEDYSTIQWFKLDGNAPTLEEINVEFEKQKYFWETKQQRKAESLNSAHSKLAALGLTPEEIAALSK